MNVARSAVLGLALAGSLLPCAPTYGESVTVTTALNENNVSTDPNLGTGTSLWEALYYATSPIVIDFAPELDGQSIMGRGGDLAIKNEVTIDASALADGVVFSREFILRDDATLTALNVHWTEPIDRAVTVESGILVLTDCTLRQRGIHLEAGTATLSRCHLNGVQAGDTRTRARVLFLSQSAELTLEDCTVEGFEADHAVIRNLGKLTVDRCMIRNNSGGQDSPAALGHAGRGGAISSSGTLEINDCHFHRNDADLGSAVWVPGGAAIIRRSTFTENRESAVSNTLRFGDCWKANLTVVNCTFFQNDFLAIDATGGGFKDTGTLLIRNCTIAENGEGVLVRPPLAIIENCIIAHNESYDLSGSGDPADFTLAAPNLLSSRSNFVDGITDQHFLLIGDPLLGALGDHGGFTPTIPIRDGSPAIDASGENAPPADQRGVAQIGRRDLGAYESDVTTPPPLPGFDEWALTRIPEGQDRTYWGDANGDGTPNGIDFAIGAVPSIPGSAQSLLPSLRRVEGTTTFEIHFGFNPEAAPHTIWSLRHSSDLESFSEIYRYRGPSATTTIAPGVSALSPPGNFVVRDSRPSQRGFYVLEVFYIRP